MSIKYQYSKNNQKKLGGKKKSLSLWRYFDYYFCKASLENKNK